MGEHKRLKSRKILGTTWARKFKLLLWKNFTVQIRSKLHTLIEIVLPLVFMLAFGYLRVVMPVEKFPEPTVFPAFDVKSVPGVLKTTTKIFYTPSTPYWDDLMGTIHKEYFTARRLNYDFEGFATEADLVKAYDNSTRGMSATVDYLGVPKIMSPVLAGIIFPEMEPSENSSKIQYALRFPAYQRTDFEIFSERLFLKPSWYTDTLYPIFTLPGPRSAKKNSGGLPGYLDEGFLYLQNAIESTIIKTFLNETQKGDLESYRVNMQRFPYPAYSKDEFTAALQIWFCYFLVFAFVYPVMSITKSIVYEKECRLKEYMKIMGLPNWLHWTAWFIKAFVSLGLSCLLILLLVKVKLTGERSILTETDSWIIMLVLMCHSVTIIGFCFFMSTLFATANTAATAAGFVWSINFIPFGYVFPRINMMTRVSKYWSCLLVGNIPISYVCYIFAMFEGTSAGVQWSNITEGTTPDDDFSILDCIVMMLVNAGVSMIAGFYIELVWPGKYGVPLPWYFPFTKWYWTNGIQQGSTLDLGNDVASNKRNKYFEGDPVHLKAGIHIQGLTKKFGKNVAVKNLDLKFYENQVTALLGHNGAGKTTTMSMLTGLVTPSSGTAIVNGYDISKDMRAVRCSLGLCPQYNVLFDELTVEEHIKFFSLLKGYTDSEATQEANRVIEILGFEAKRNAQAQTLSGGMKRKLSVGIAFCAGSKAVLLDEPTSGMDPGARRSLFLKKQYGGDHQLIIVKQPICIPNMVLNFLQNNIPSIRLKDEVGAELSYFLPDDQSSEFPALFEELESQKDLLGISSFGVGNTSMEEVFMRVGKQDQKNNDSKDVNGAGATQNTPMLSNGFERDGPRYTGLELSLHQLKAVLVKKLLFLMRNQGLALLQMAIPVISVSLCMWCFKSLPGLTTPTPLFANLDKYENIGRTIILTSCDSNSQICEGYRDFISEKYSLENHPNSSVVDAYLEKATESQRYAESKFMVGLEEDSASKTLTAYFNNQPFHNPPVALNFISNGWLRYFGVEAEISVVNHPFDYNDADNIKQAGNIFTLPFFAGWIIEFTLGIMGGAFIIFPVYERMVGAKHLQFVAGLKAPIYWAGAFMIDIVNYMIPCTLMLVVLMVMNIQQFMQYEVILWYLVMCFLHGAVMISMMDLFSFVFTIPASGFARMTLFNSGSGLSAMVTVLALENPELDLTHLADALHNVFIFIPNYALGMGIIQVAVHHDLKESCENFNLESLCKLDKNFICCRKYQESFYAWEPSGIGKNLVSLFCYTIVFFLGVLLLENKIHIKTARYFRRICTRKLEQPSVSDQDDNEMTDDEDVTREAERINSQSLISAFKTDNLVIRKVRKVYNRNLTAVKDLSLGVPKGETFGLLGVNGAGKTTLFKMITGDIELTSGDIFLCKNSVRRNLSEVYRNLGYCPQFDALIEQLTGRETIRMFANEKGIQDSHIDRITNNLAESLMFTKHIDKKVWEYSGGNRRKLSTAVAMLGNPKVIFLDEPTTGLDPVARRHVWNAVNLLRESGTSVVITSHSMEECEALCSRLAIMVDGRFRCLGSPQHLKNKFGEGYSIVAQLNYTSTTSSKTEQDNQVSGNLQPWELELGGLKDFIKSHFPDCELKDSHPGYVQYYVPGSSTKWARLFAVMEKAKEEFNLDAYSVGQTSLEQVFLNFTTMAKSYEE
ncbi:unnamed protein product [Allacma fusca]|uniref:ABC transporter domain-containing protein n=1 Tax=Allacma fusca TaxID=39272 RepID=A0A8J2JC61_9HEXA|nr:unnamed protein product [Allacma fusca]